MKHKFKDGFYWGTAISALQTEGTHPGDGKADSTFDVWFKDEPERFFGGEGNGIAVDFYHMYKEDIRLMKELNHNSFRFSIAWSRLIPNGDGVVNEKAVEFYNGVIDELLANGIEPFICLFHFDMPWIMQEKGGLESLEVVNDFAEYAEIAFNLFGDRVKKWFTHNEPIVPIEGCYLYGFLPRRVKAKDVKMEGEVTNPEYFFDHYELPGRLFNKDRGWEIYPKGVYDLLLVLKDEYNNIPVYISENGIGRHNGDAEDTDENGYINDDARIEFVKGHLEWLWEAQELGSNICGYHMWSLMDNWSMSNAFKNKYGYLHVDRENGLKRSIKKSGHWIAEVSKNNGF